MEKKYFSNPSSLGATHEAPREEVSRNTSEVQVKSCKKEETWNKEKFREKIKKARKYYNF